MTMCLNMLFRYELHAEKEYGFQASEALIK